MATVAKQKVMIFNVIPTTLMLLTLVLLLCLPTGQSNVVIRKDGRSIILSIVNETVIIDDQTADDLANEEQTERSTHHDHLPKMLNQHCQSNDDCRQEYYESTFFQVCHLNHCQCQTGYQPGDDGYCKGNYDQRCSDNRHCNSDLFCGTKNSGVKVCMKKAFFQSECNYTAECQKTTKGRVECSSSSTYFKTCACQPGTGYKRTSGSCIDLSEQQDAALQIYKITMIFASCCLATVLIIFLVCILRKSYCPRNRDRQNSQVPLDNTTIPDIFTMYPDAANFPPHSNTNRAAPFEKPPTYDETLRFMREEFGVPPPAYNRTPESTPPNERSNNRVVFNRPLLLAVSQQNSQSTGQSNSYSSGSSGHSSLSSVSSTGTRSRQMVAGSQRSDSQSDSASDDVDVSDMSSTRLLRAGHSSGQRNNQSQPTAGPSGNQRSERFGHVNEAFSN